LELTKAQFKTIFDTYYNPLCNFCCKYLQDRGDVEDVVQEVLVKLWQNKEKIHLQKDVKFYLFTSVKNKAIELIRSRKRKGEILDTLKPEKNFEEPVGEEVDSTILKEKLYNSIRQLPPKCQEIFVMNKVNGLTYNEISEELNISPKTVDNQMRRAFKLLREKFGITK
jgi:RNA polymerase sigma-70 factor (ECF subfamily)